MFEVEIGTYERYLPDERTLAAISVPVQLLVSEDGLPVFAEVAGRLSKRLGVEVATTPGRHDAYHTHPDDLAEAARPFLRDVSSADVDARPPGRSPQKLERASASRTTTAASWSRARPR